MTNPSVSIEEQLQGITKKALRRGIVLFTAIAIPVVSVSVLRGVQGAWLPAFTVQLVVLAILLGTAPFRHRLPHAFLAILAVGIGIIAGWAGLFNYGTIAPAGHWLVALAVFFIGMLYNRRGMITATAVMLMGILIIAWLHLSAYFSPAVPAAAYVIAASSWAVELMCALLFIVVVLPTLHDFVSTMSVRMSEFEQRRDEIAHLADHDELTGLPLLRIARDRLAMACRRTQQSDSFFAVLFIDLDGFKQVNDSHGHAAGDSCLRAVASRLTDRLRTQDTIARIGGDEFMVILEDMSGRDAVSQVVLELIALIKQPIDFNGKELQVGASIGVALSSSSANDAANLLRNADQAMYQSKRRGTNGFLFAEIDTVPEIETEYHQIEQDSVAVSVVDSVDRQSIGNQLLEAIVERCILVLSVIVSLAILANVWRVIVNQSAPNLGATLVMLVLLLVLLFGRKAIPLAAKLALTASLGFLIAIPGLYFTGLAGPAVGWGLASSIFMIGVFYDRRLSIGVAIFVPVIIIACGLGFVSGRLGYPVDVTQEALHPAKWLVYLLAMAAYSGLVLSAWSLNKKTVLRLMAETAVQIEELTHLATIDELTGLPMLRVANDRLHMACSRARRDKQCAALLLVDLDSFKAINDNLGHDAGDHCLREVANRMLTQLQPTDTVARIGGDEFLIVLDRISDAAQVSSIAGQIIEAVARPIEFGDRQFATSASVGIAIYPDHAPLEELLRQRADAAMYVAKRSGKNQFEFAGPVPTP